MRVRLTVKLADVVDGIDLSEYAEGNVLELSESEARLLIAEKWAEPVRDSEEITRVPYVKERIVAADEGVPTVSKTKPASPNPSGRRNRRRNAGDVPSNERDFFQGWPVSLTVSLEERRGLQPRSRK
jgi:hypothetical protein